ncbi:MAG: hypothetical protein ABL873_00960, partial [Gallionella sp.]
MKNHSILTTALTALGLLLSAANFAQAAVTQDGTNQNKFKNKSGIVGPLDSKRPHANTRSDARTPQGADRRDMGNRSMDKASGNRMDRGMGDVPGKFERPGQRAGDRNSGRSQPGGMFNPPLLPPRLL